MSQVDEQPAAVLAEVRRYLEDLVLFEKAEFLMPIQALSESSEFRAEISPLGSTAEELTAFRSQICTCTRCALGHSRQRFVFGKILDVLNLDFEFEDKNGARQTMVRCSDLFRNWNYAASDGDEYRQLLERIDRFIATKGREE